MNTFFGNLKFAWRYMKQYKKMLFQYILCNLLGTVVSLVVPVLSAKVIIYLTDNQFYQLILIAIVIFLVENLRNLVHYGARHYSQVLYRNSFTLIQEDLGKNILKLENKVIDANSSGVFIQRLTNDTSRLADIFNVLNYYLTGILTNIGIFVAIFLINKLVFIYFVLVVLLLFWIEKKRTSIYNKKDEVFRKKSEKVSGFVGELVRGVRDIKMLNAEDSFMDELHTKLVDVNEMRYDMQHVDNVYSLFCRFFLDAIDLFEILLLVFLIYKGRLEMASALVIHNYAGRLPSIVDYIGMLLEKVKDFNLSSSRIFSIIDSEEFTKECFGNEHIKRVRGNFEFQNVSFGYEENNVILRDLNFKVKANETVAFVGKSGAGKSTIFSLLCKMYDGYTGSILIDGKDIRSLDKESIRGNITIISQNPYIFNLSIRDNFRLVKSDVTDAEMKKACKLACLDDFIESLPDKYETIVGEGGVNLSGGQKQRLAIARALVQKTEIILFDEATSALDNETQQSIQEAIDNMKNEYTILIIAHRLSTIIHSDRILFLDNGKIEAEGTHEELLKLSKEYKRLYDAELKNHK